MRENLASSFNGPFFWRKGMTSTRRTLLTVGALAVALAFTGTAQAQTLQTPGNIAVTAVPWGSVLISVTGHANQEAGDDDKYEIQYEETDGNDFTYVGANFLTFDIAGPGAVVSTHRLRGLKHGTRYIFRARAYNDADGTIARGTGWAGPVNATTTAADDLPKVTNLVLTALDGGLKATWNAVEDEVGTPVHSYRVTVTSAADSAAGASSRTVVVMGTVTEATIMSLVNGVEYTVAVVARPTAPGPDGGPDSSRDSTASDSKKVTPMDMPDPLPTVTGVEVTPGDGMLMVSWTAVTDPEGRAVRGYQWMVTGPGGYSAQAMVSGTTTSATIPNLANGTAYGVTVRARAATADGMADDDRDGAWSASKSATPMAGAGDGDGDGDQMPTPTPAVPLVGILALFAGLLAAGRARLRR